MKRWLGWWILSGPHEHHVVMDKPEARQHPEESVRIIHPPYDQEHAKERDDNGG